ELSYSPFHLSLWFQYSPENVQGPGCDIDPSEVILPGCSCYTHSCLRESSSCLQTYGQTYDRLSPGPEEIQEIVTAGLCLSVTPCVAVVRSAGNWVVQRSLGLKLCVYSTEDRGLGVRALEPISCGTFVCEYAGKPNLFMVPVQVHSLVPRLALFAGRDYSGSYSNTHSMADQLKALSVRECYVGHVPPDLAIKTLQSPSLIVACLACKPSLESI
uniref:SET domain and mariner transposase fusion gene n=1 Tax=Hucho hucho TaxID=62062 RepID=A0A4W5QGA4_9TELE